ncbi:MAG TPA: pyridoxamine 5'-phosphate oxidase family protein [Terriglobales bacterium]|nr:pyridoxamine 5'-phosphate oxidase family protein [Terriglobales bacterium]
MAKFFATLEPEHIEFISRQRMFFVASSADDGFPNLSPKGYDTLAVLGPQRLAYADWPGSGNQTATHIAAQGRLTLMFCSFERVPLILRVYGQAQVIRHKTEKFDLLAAQLGERAGPHTRQLIDIEVRQVQTSCGYAVPLFDYRGQRQTLQGYYDKKHAEVDWEEYLTQRSQPQRLPF